MENAKCEMLCFHLCYLLHLLFFVYNGFSFIKPTYWACAMGKLWFLAFWAWTYVSQLAQALSDIALKDLITAMGHRPRLTLFGGRFLHMIY